MKSQDTKSSDELQGRVRQELRNVRRDLDELQGRFTPGQFIDDVIFYSHGGNIKNAVDHLKKNPIGTSFLSLGTLLLMEDEEHKSMEYRARSRANSGIEKINEARDKIRGQMPHKELVPGQTPNKADIAKGKVSAFSNRFQSKFSEIRQGLSEKLPHKGKKAEGTFAGGDELGTEFGIGEERSFKDRFSSAVAARKIKVKDTFSRNKDKFTNTYSQGKERAANAYGYGKDRIHNLDPLSFMALGAGLGALTGASLPVSDKERDLIDSRLSDRLSGFSEDLEQAINECSNILKDLVIQDVKDYNVKIFRR